jgi:hypothetical protein
MATTRVYSVRRIHNGRFGGGDQDIIALGKAEWYNESGTKYYSSKEKGTRALKRIQGKGNVSLHEMGWDFRLFKTKYGWGIFWKE